MRKSLVIGFFFMEGFFMTEKLTCARTVHPAKLVVVPFQNTGKVRGQDYMQLQFAATVAERLETVPAYEVTSGPLVLTADIAKLAPSRDKTGRMSDFDLAGANALALSNGASVFLTGHYAGSEWKWSLTTEVYAAQTNGPQLIGSATVNGDLTTAIQKKSGRTVRIVDIHAIHNLLAQVVSDAMFKAKLPDAHLIKQALRAPSTQDSWAFIQLGLAYNRYFSPPDLKHHRSTLEIAKYAVLVDPAYAEAQRFYSAMLEEEAEEKPENRNKILGIARLHYELALKIRPDDTRTLIHLGQLELWAKNEDTAREYLKRAVAIHPQDPEPHFWLAKVSLKLGDSETAIAEFEKVRDLSSAHLDARRELVRLYNQRLRYMDSIKELRVIVSTDPGDKEAAFALPAVLRAMGENFLAAEQYRLAEWLFPEEPRFARFRLNVERATDGLFTSVNAINEGGKTIQTIKEMRDIFQLAANDATMDFGLNGKDACADGRGASSVMLAKKNERLHADQLQILYRSTDIIKDAIRQNNDAAFTSNEHDNAEAVLAALKATERDSREMRAQMALAVSPLMQKSGCETIDQTVHTATVENLDRRNQDWVVTLPAVKPGSSTPEIPTSSDRIIHFYVDNTAGNKKYYLMLDDAKLGAVDAGHYKKLNARRGYHNICLQPQLENCNLPGNTLRAPLDEGLTLEIKPGQK